MNKIRQFCRGCEKGCEILQPESVDLSQVRRTALESVKNSIKHMNSVLVTQINEKVPEPLRKSSEPQPRGCEIFRTETVNFNQDLSDSARQMIPSSAPRSLQREREETSAIRPSRGEKWSNRLETAAESVEDSAQLDRIASPVRETRSSPARKAAAIQLGSRSNRNSDDRDRNSPESDEQVAMASNPSSEIPRVPTSARCSSTAELSSPPASSCPSQQPESNERLRGNSKNTAIISTEDPNSAVRVPNSTARVARCESIFACPDSNCANCSSAQVAESRLDTY